MTARCTVRLVRLRFVCLAGCAALVGCATPVFVEHAPYGSDPVCAVVLQRAPVELDGRERRATTSQGSRAWGDDRPVVLRCGVDPPGPSTDRCVRITAVDGQWVDWIALEGDAAWTFVTYGRRPAVEIRVPVGDGAAGEPEGAAAGPGQPTAPLLDLTSAVSATAVERTCL